ncbi:MAG: nucleotidyltransferase domain-containing protein [Anaerolineae bacterium]|nr:nucleotidyltransferase domain-containing protein [Anaerolineae bacterium]
MVADKKDIPSLRDLRARRDEILALAARYRAYNVRIFGSVARGDATEDSDIDFLVSFQDSASLYDLAGLWQSLQDLLGHQVDIADAASPKRRFLDRALKDAVPL